MQACDTIVQICGTGNTGHKLVLSLMTSRSKEKSMPDVGCEQLNCLEIYCSVRVRVILIQRNSECPKLGLDSSDFDKVKNDLRKEIEKTYPPFTRVLSCPNGCHCKTIGDVKDTPVKGEQYVRTFRASDCEYYLILEVDVERVFVVGVCRSGTVPKPGGE